MKINRNIFRGYDIRGLVDKDLSPEFALHLGRAFGTYMKRRGKSDFVVAHDCRATSPEYSENIIQGLRETGANVTFIGMHLVGTFYWSQHHLGLEAGVYVSASHNPPEYNGFKLANGLSETLVSDGMRDLADIISNEDYDTEDNLGVYQQVDIRPAYFQDLLSRIKVDRKLRVVIDPSCTTAGSIAPDLLRQAGCEVVEYNTEVDPTFPLGIADPTESSVMERLSREVLESKADIGLTFDSDGDRIGIVDETGRIIWNDVLVALFAKDVLRKHPSSTIMFNTLCSRVVPEAIEALGGKPFMWRTGHSFLKKKNQEVGASFIGELSGHFFFSKDFYNHDDGLYSALRILSLLGSSNISLSEHVDQLPKYVSSPEIKLYCDDDKKVDLMTKISPILAKDYREAEIIDDDRAGDGVRLETADGMFMLRYSQNGPYITIKFESKHQAEYEDLKHYIGDLLRKFPEVEWDNPINTNLEALAD